MSAAPHGKAGTSDGLIFSQHSSGPTRLRKPGLPTRLLLGACIRNLEGIRLGTDPVRSLPPIPGPESALRATAAVCRCGSAGQRPHFTQDLTYWRKDAQREAQHVELELYGLPPGMRPSRVPASPKLSRTDKTLAESRAKSIGGNVKCRRRESRRGDTIVCRVS